MNPLDLTPSQLKRAAALKEQLDGLKRAARWSEQRAAQYSRGFDQLCTRINEKADYGRVSEKENCGCSKGKMGKASTCQICDSFPNTSLEGQKEDNEFSGQSKVIR
jgi:hypothetical protein